MKKTKVPKEKKGGEGKPDDGLALRLVEISITETVVRKAIAVIGGTKGTVTLSAMEMIGYCRNWGSTISAKKPVITVLHEVPMKDDSPEEFARANQEIEGRMNDPKSL